MGCLGAVAKEQAEQVVRTWHTLSTLVSALSSNPRDLISVLLSHGSGLSAFLLVLVIAAHFFHPLAVQHANYAASVSVSLWAWISHSKETSALEPSMAMNHRIRHPRGIYFWSLTGSPGTPQQLLLFFTYSIELLAF